MTDPTAPAAPPAGDPAANPPATGAGANPPPVDPPSDPPAVDPANPPADPPKDGEPTGAPETYADFAMPDGFELDAKALEGFTPVAKELNLTQDQAQKLVSYYADQVKAMGAGSEEAAEKWYAERQQAEIAEANAKGIEAIKADTELGGDKFDGVKVRVSEAVGAIGTPELRAEFDRLGLGNNPEIVRFVHRLIDYTPQDRGIGQAGGGGAPKSLAERMYPKT